MRGPTIAALFVAGLIALPGAAHNNPDLRDDQPQTTFEPDELGRVVYRKANCVGCHKWHGGGGGGYGGAALSLRATTLDHDGLMEVVRCGRPGTGMPFHDRAAYKAKACYGLKRADVGKHIPPRAKKILRDAEIEAVANYVIGTMKGRGEPSLEDCTSFWGEDARQCDTLRE